MPRTRHGRPCILSLLANSGHIQRRISLYPAFSQLGTDPSLLAQDDALMMFLPAYAFPPVLRCFALIPAIAL